MQIVSINTSASCNLLFTLAYQTVLMSTKHTAIHNKQMHNRMVHVLFKCYKFIYSYTFLVWHFNVIRYPSITLKLDTTLKIVSAIAIEAIYELF